MKFKKDTELITNKENKIYHLNIDETQIADNIILVGDPSRVIEVSKHFNIITHKINHREFITHTGTYNNKNVSVISTGIGCDNIDIVINELDAVVSFNLKKKTKKKKKRTLNLIRIGTSGSIQEDVKIDSFLLSKYAIGLDGLAHFYKKKDHIDLDATQSFKDHMNLSSSFAEPYIVKASNNLINKFKRFKQGMTITASGFYAPQGREIRLDSSIKNMHEVMREFKYKGERITNFEMESSALYFLGRSLGHNTITICAIMGNRVNQTQSENYNDTMNSLINTVLENL